MAQLKRRGNKFAVSYYYKGDDGLVIEPQYESYDNELEAIQRKGLIEALKKSKNEDMVKHLALEYKASKPPKRVMNKTITPDEGQRSVKLTMAEKRETLLSDFAPIWLPRHARKNEIKGGSYTGIQRQLDKHILPYFAGFKVSEIGAEEIDGFLDYMKTKKCSGSKARGKAIEEIPLLSSGTAKKCYDVIKPMMKAAIQWGYKEAFDIPKAPSVKYSDRDAWDIDEFVECIQSIDDPLLHLAIHLTFFLSLRNGELTAIELSKINLKKREIEIMQNLQRMKDDAIKELPDQEIYKKFPKINPRSTTTLVCTSPKSDKRTSPISEELVEEIRDRILQIEKNKEFYGKDYHDNNLLICHPNGDPIEPRYMVKIWNDCQNKLGIRNTIDMQGLRKTAETWKTTVTEDVVGLTLLSGHKENVLYSRHYQLMNSKRKQNIVNDYGSKFYSICGGNQKEAIDEEKPDPTEIEKSAVISDEQMLRYIQENPQLVEQVLNESLNGKDASSNTDMHPLQR